VARHAVVTGAAEGIGRAVVEVLGAHGYAIAGIDVNADLAAQTQQALAGRGLEVAFLLGDLSLPADVDRIAASLAAGPEIDVGFRTHLHPQTHASLAILLLVGKLILRSIGNAASGNASRKRLFRYRLKSQPLSPTAR
jgi:NAD(P)-dependent dehydrogenase (short-subunit alcohol dehydrogenase family)